MTRLRILIGILFVGALALLFMYSVQTHHPDNTVDGIGPGTGSAKGPAAPRPAAGALCRDLARRRFGSRYAAYDATAGPRTFGRPVRLPHNGGHARLTAVTGATTGVAGGHRDLHAARIGAPRQWRAGTHRGACDELAGLGQTGDSADGRAAPGAAPWHYSTAVGGTCWVSRRIIPGLLAGEASGHPSDYLTFQRPNGSADTCGCNAVSAIGAGLG